MTGRPGVVADGERTPRRRLGPLIVVFLAVPVVLVAAFYLASRQFDVAFGDLVLALTGITAAGWFLVTRSENASLGAAGASRLGALAGWDTVYAGEMSARSSRPYGSPGVVVLVLTATVILGWIVVAVRWVLG